MRQRHSRFNRIYRHLTRRTPDRASQWRQISQLRSQGSAGWPSATTSRSASVTRGASTPELVSPAAHKTVEHAQEDWSWLPERPTTEPQLRSASRALVALGVCLSLLACAYAGLSDFHYAWDDVFCWLGVSGAIASLVTAALCVKAAAASLAEARDGRLLYVCAAFLSCLYFVLLACSLR